MTQWLQNLKKNLDNLLSCNISMTFILNDFGFWKDQLLLFCKPAWQFSHTFFSSFFLLHFGLLHGFSIHFLFLAFFSFLFPPSFFPSLFFLFYFFFLYWVLLYIHTICSIQCLVRTKIFTRNLNPELRGEFESKPNCLIILPVLHVWGQFTVYEKNNLRFLVQIWCKELF